VISEVIWTAHATKRLRQRFGLEVRSMSIHAEAITNGARFFGGRVAQIKLGPIYLECRWVEGRQAAVILTCHKGRALRVARHASKTNAKRAKGNLAKRRDRWDGDE